MDKIFVTDSNRSSLDVSWMIAHIKVDLKISLFVLINIKVIPEKFAFLILRILELFARKVCIFRKK